MNNIIGKYGLELNFPGDGRKFLNYWDAIKGQDVCAEIIGGHLYVEGEKVPLGQFLLLVENSIRLSYETDE
jgi:hypothetical protein